MGKDVCVYLIGGGPGDPGLFTLKGKQCLEEADVVIYDYLASGRLLRYANPDAELIFVGKKGFTQHVTQDEINKIIIEKAQQEGVKKVARLKGGDPFVFGRGGEEALALKENGIHFEVVPGVTAGVAAPAYAGIPVTHRGIASSVAFITGHEDPTKDESAIDWAYLAKGVDTLCFYMGIKALPLIAERLISEGRDANTAVALVRWGTTPSQEILVSTLDKVAEEAAAKKFKAPAIILVGDVAQLREKLHWFEDKKTLLGQHIVVTRSRTQASALTDQLEAKGAEVFEFPTIQITPPSSFASLDAAIDELDEFNWLIFTSVNGVSGFFERLAQSGKDSRALGGMQIAAIGPSTAESLSKWGIAADVIPSEYKAEGVLESLQEAGIKAGDKALLARAAVARDILPEGLKAAGIDVVVAPVYETRIDSNGKAKELLELLENKEINTVTFASSSTVENFMLLLEQEVSKQEALELLEGTCIASIGPITSQTARDLGLNVALEAIEYTIPGLVEALEKQQ